MNMKTEFINCKSLIFGLCIITWSLGGMDKNPATIAEPQTAKWAQKWWMPRHESKLAEIKKHKGHFDLVFIGDSITQGWQGKAARNALAKDFAGKNILNLGFKGDYTGHVLWRLQNGELKGVSAKVAVIMIGTNNTTRGDSASQTAEGVKVIVDEVRKKMPSTKVLLLSVFPRSKPNHKFRIKNGEINKIIKGFADDKSVFWSDLTNVFMNEKQELHTDLFARDQLHLRDKGYEVWSKTLSQRINDISTSTENVR